MCGRRCQGFWREYYPDAVGVEILSKMHFSLDAAVRPISLPLGMLSVWKNQILAVETALRIEYFEEKLTLDMDRRMSRRKNQEIQRIPIHP
jgi:hypothetical protein